jgi:cytochrome c biogenesis protein CcdA
MLAALLGVRHAFAPDHLAAVSTFTEKTEATRRQGIFYALRIAAGHSVGMLAEAVVLMGLLIHLPVAWDTGTTWASAIWLLAMALWISWDLVRELAWPHPKTSRQRTLRWTNALKRPTTAWFVGLLFGIAVSPGDLAIFSVMARDHANLAGAFGYLFIFLLAMFIGLACVGGGLGWANARVVWRRAFQGLSGFAGMGIAVALMIGWLH